MNEEHPESTKEKELPRWVQIPVGLVFFLFVLLCLLGSITLVVSPNEKAPIAAPLVGSIMVLASLWLLSICGRLVIGRKANGGLMSPFALRAVAIFFILLPVAGIFTGYFKEHSFRAIFQTLVNVSIFISLRALANRREAARKRA